VFVESLHREEKYLDAFCCTVLFGVCVTGACCRNAVHSRLLLCVLKRVLIKRGSINYLTSFLYYGVKYSVTCNLCLLFN
jgi:hypothetical protein